MNLFFKVALAVCPAGLFLPLYGQPIAEGVDLSRILLTVSLDGANISAFQQDLNRSVPSILFDLESDERDTAAITLKVQEIPLPKLLDDVCKVLHYQWSVDAANRSINLFPADTRRYSYYPFGLAIPPINMRDEDRYEVLGSIISSSLMKGKYGVIVTFHFSESSRKRFKRFQGTLENMTLRQAFNWLCAKGGENICWRSTYNPSYGIASFNFISKLATPNEGQEPAK